MSKQSISIQAGIGDLFCVLTANGVGYSPDLVHDMTQRVKELITETHVIGVEFGTIPNDEYFEEEEVASDIDVS